MGNNLNVSVGGGGIFSKYMLVIQNISNLDFDRIYINISDNRTYSNMFDYIFNQNYFNNIPFINCSILPTYTNINKIELSNNFENYKNVINKLTFNENILNKVNYYKNILGIDENTIGVHVRLTDMNIHHPEYGNRKFDDYLNFLSLDNEYFVSSDNNESLVKLKTIFGDKVKYIEKFIRADYEHSDSLNLQLNMFKNELLWEESFIEMLLLSKCGTLVCGVSNLSNSSIIHSRTLKNIIRI